MKDLRLQCLILPEGSRWEIMLVIVGHLIIPTPTPTQEPCILDEVITAIPDITAYVLETVGADIRSDKVTLVEGAEDSFFVGLGDAVGWAETVLRCSAAFPG